MTQAWGVHPLTFLSGNQEQCRQLLHRVDWDLQQNAIKGQETSLNISLAKGEVDPKLNSRHCLLWQDDLLFLENLNNLCFYLLDC